MLRKVKDSDNIDYYTIPDTIIDISTNRRPQSLVFWYDSSRRHCQLYQHASLIPLRIQLQEPIEPIQLVRQSLHVIQPVNAKDNLMITMKRGDNFTIEKKQE